jgi:co-chaperonin GroES (HSP10)
MIKEKERESMKIKPFGERVAVKIVPIEEKTASGLIVATSSNNSNRGEIVALGEEVKEYFHLGDKVVFLPNAGLNYTDGSDEYRVISTKDVICKIIEE